MSDLAMDNLKGFIRKGARLKTKAYIPTGHFELDFSIKYGMLPSNIDLDSIDYDPSVPLGLPCGRLVEIFGGEGSGKSSLAYRVCGFAQKMGYEAVWIDTEHSFEENLAELNGVNIDTLHYSEMWDEKNPDKNYFAEDLIDKICEICIHMNNVKVIVLDSLANLIPKTRFESSASKEDVGKIARLLSNNLGKVSQYAAKHGVLIIFINQIREKIGIMFGNPETTPGGRALKHNSSIRLKLNLRTNKESLITIEDENGRSKIIGRYSGATIVKNRMGPPLIDSSSGKRIILESPIYYQSYFPNIGEQVFDLGRQLKAISVRKNVFTWKEFKAEGRMAFIKKLLENDLINPLVVELVALAKTNNTILPPEIANLCNTCLSKEEKNDKSKTVKQVHRGRPKKNS